MVCRHCPILGGCRKGSRGLKLPEPSWQAKLSVQTSLIDAKTYTFMLPGVLMSWFLLSESPNCALGVGRKLSNIYCPAPSARLPSPANMLLPVGWCRAAAIASLSHSVGAIEPCCRDAAAEDSDSKRRKRVELTAKEVRLAVVLVPAGV